MDQNNQPSQPIPNSADQIGDQSEPTPQNPQTPGEGVPPPAQPATTSVASDTNLPNTQPVTSDSVLPPVPDQMPPSVQEQPTSPVANTVVTDNSTPIAPPASDSMPPIVSSESPQQQSVSPVAETSANDAPPPQDDTPTAKKPHTLLLMTLVTAAVLSIGGVGLFMIMQQQDTTMNLGATKQRVPTPTTLPAASPTTVNTDSELDTLDTGNPESDLTELDTDVSGL